jgi:hypothetical protein
MARTKLSLSLQAFDALNAGCELVQPGKGRGQEGQLAGGDEADDLLPGQGEGGGGHRRAFGQDTPPGKQKADAQN